MVFFVQALVRSRDLVNAFDCVVDDMAKVLDGTLDSSEASTEILSCHSDRDIFLG